MEALESQMAAGVTQTELNAELTQALSSIPASDPNWGEALIHYNSSIATKIVDNLLDDSVAAADKAVMVDYIPTQVAAGKTFNAIIEWAVTALDSVDHFDSTWGNAAAFLDNRIDVLQYYSVDKAGTATDPNRCCCFTECAPPHSTGF